MNNSDLVVMKEAIKKMESKVYRDFMELENLQNSSSTNKFVNMTLRRLKKDFYDFFTTKRNGYSVIIKDGQSNMVEDAKKTIYVNCLVGIKNFTHSLPYFATVLSIKEKNKYVAALVNNYATQEMFLVESGGGAFLNLKRIRVSNKNDLTDVVVGIKYDVARSKLAKIIGGLNMSFKINNCCILDMCQTAAGKLDGGIIFDAPADELKIGELFVVEAGGFFEFTNGPKTDCVYSNSLIHSGLTKSLEAVNK